MHELTSVPRYTTSFSCLGPTCPDTCCSAWDVGIDGETHEKWQTISLHKDGPPLAARSRLVPAGESHGVGIRALVDRLSTGECVWLTQDKLCGVQLELGEDLIPKVCHTYPRGLVQRDRHISMFMTLGCPQAARLALADASAMDMVPPTQQPLGRLPRLQAPHRAAPQTIEAFMASTLEGIDGAAALLADAAQRLIRIPELTVWQAWALYWEKALGVLVALKPTSNKRAAVERLSALQRLARREEGLLPAARLAEENFVAAVLPMPARLENAFSYACDVVRQLEAKFGDAKPNIHTQALALSHALAPFGLSDNPQPAAMAAACQLYQRALREWFEPFDNAHPHLLKNHLLNRLALRNFPVSSTQRFGEELAHEAMDLDVLRVFLVGQALTKRSEFGIDDYVVLVQAFTRHLTHPLDI
jgi:lysine-N-methylase